ncbi:hypothetical protein H6F72_27555 [Trichocoleus sp. FACHB-46]|nr:hypothetical protein [Trichocoleus sp. FACHB-46]
MSEKYTVILTPEERQQLFQFTHQNKLGARRLKRAQILLLADEGHRDEPSIRRHIAFRRIDGSSDSAEICYGWC